MFSWWINQNLPVDIILSLQTCIQKLFDCNHAIFSILRFAQVLFMITIWTSSNQLRSFSYKYLFSSHLWPYFHYTRHCRTPDFVPDAWHNSIRTLIIFLPFNFNITKHSSEVLSRSKLRNSGHVKSCTPSYFSPLSNKLQRAFLPYHLQFIIHIEICTHISDYKLDNLFNESQHIPQACILRRNR